MGIQPPSDIVFGVMQAADPTRQQAVISKLRALAMGAPSESLAFDQVMPPKGLPATPAPPLTPGLAPFAVSSTVSLRNATALSRQQAGAGADVTPAAASFRKFEAMVMSQFVQAMMPQKAEAVFGNGNAGQIWKSMLAEKIADQAARAGGIGIAQRLATAFAARNQDAAQGAAQAEAAGATGASAAAALATATGLKARV
ncbi:rod-binding protein [Aquabacter sp. L1I39]|uniref:rod-binding protein n=1 Tax=Aquabacter sp. L1I39 TaxID=2820278 RepID=UPI001AD9B065|nr:rod-binding protein [Aquabacter sp. L1I39]QTL04302.1 rod-binding protein [Aquabacter sp. L1I39]